MNGRFSTYKKAKWMDDLAGTDLWLGVCWANPLIASDPLTTEVPVTRQYALWVRSSPTLLTLNIAEVFRNLLPGAVVAAVAVWDAAIGGHLIGADLYQVPISYPTGGTHTIASGQFVLGIDV